MFDGRSPFTLPELAARLPNSAAMQGRHASKLGYWQHVLESLFASSAATRDRHASTHAACTAAWASWSSPAGTQAHEVLAACSAHQRAVLSSIRTGKRTRLLAVYCAAWTRQSDSASSGLKSAGSRCKAACASWYASRFSACGQKGGAEQLRKQFWGACVSREALHFSACGWGGRADECCTQ
jgi:hypothetical protein